jgi:hypothetical protein
MRTPQQQSRSRAASPYATGAGRSKMPAMSPGRSQGLGLARGEAKLYPTGGAPSATPGKGGPRRRKPPGYGPPGWYPPDWRGGIVRAAPPPEFGPGSSTAAPDTGSPDDAAWQAPTPLNWVAPTTGPGLFVIERRTGSQWTRAYVGMSASGVGQALRWIVRAPRILGVQADLEGLRVRVAEAPFDTATPMGRETLRRWRNDVAGADDPAGNTAVSRGSAPVTTR